MLDGNGVKTIPGSITVPTPGLSIICTRENKGSQMGHTKKYLKIRKKKRERELERRENERER
jgi:hypothetical protein